MLIRYLSILFLSSSSFIFAHTNPLLQIPNNPFKYDLGIKIIPCNSEHKGPQKKEVTICCHGYSHCNRIVYQVLKSDLIRGYCVGFNFPEHGIKPTDDHLKTTFGTVDEILPFLYVLKYYACDLQVPTINLYGFSGGAGSIINAIGTLSSHTYPNRLSELGITKHCAKQMLSALQNGYVILDCPFKSIDESIAFKGTTPTRETLASRRKKNNMNPIDALDLWTEVKLNILLHYQSPDEIIGNRDDQLFAKKLKKANKGIVHVATSSHGGHVPCRGNIWREYKKFIT